MRVRSTRRQQTTLVVASLAVLLAAADTYVVVLALPDIMTGVGVGVDELQRAAPIVSVFLLGYVAMLPLLGRLSDVYGRVPLLVVSLAVFALGSLVTAAATDLAGAVTGRFLQGMGGGGLVPVTIAYVADLWDERRRGVPLGLVGAVQELGAVLGPLLGAAVLAVWDWRAIFVLNLVAGLVLAAGLLVVNRSVGPEAGPDDRPRHLLVRDPIGVALLVLGLAGLVLAIVRPESLVRDVRLGGLFFAWAPTGLSPLWLATGGVLIAFFWWEAGHQNRMLHPASLWRGLLAADLVGGLLVAGALGGVILAFATADPAVQLVADQWPVLLGISAVATVMFIWRQRRVANPLIPLDGLRARPAWGSLVVSVLVGAALVVVLVDVPVYGRAVIAEATQWDAALLLLRFLVALPVGAVLGGWALRRLAAGPLASAGMLAAALALAAMTRWDAGSVEQVSSDLTLLLAGVGFGFAVAPVNAALLAAVRDDLHGIGSALLVVARMVGMLVGLSALTAIALRRFYDALSEVPVPDVVCPQTPLDCPAYAEAVRSAVLTQVTTTFAGAAVCAAAAALLSLLLLGRGSLSRPESRRTPATPVPTSPPG